MESTLKLRSLLRILCILLLVPSYVYSQSPGGVRGQQFWYDDKDSTGALYLVCKSVFCSDFVSERGSGQ